MFSIISPVTANALPAGNAFMYGRDEVAQILNPHGYNHNLYFSIEEYETL